MNEIVIQRKDGSRFFRWVEDLDVICLTIEDCKQIINLIETATEETEIKLEIEEDLYYDKS